MPTILQQSTRLLCGIVLAAALPCNAQEIRTVIGDGVGSDPQSAAQDAAQNALTNVVGSFIDANKQLEKRSEIRDGIRSQTTQIRTDIREYSQGSIQSFEVVEARKDGPFYRVTAKVCVRVAEFRAYVKKLAEGETSVGTGLFAEMATTQKQSQSLASMLAERLLAIVNGESLKFIVSKPVPFRRSRFASGMGPVSRLGQASPDQVAVFDVTVELDDAFVGNLINTLDSVAASKRRISTSDQSWNFYRMRANCEYLRAQSNTADTGSKITTGAQRYLGRLGGAAIPSAPEPRRQVQQPKQDADSSFCLPVMDTNESTATVFFFANIDHELTQSLHWSFMNMEGSFDMENDIYRRTVVIPKLEIAVLDRNGKELQVEIISGEGVNRTVAIENKNPWMSGKYPWLLYNGAKLLRHQTFSVAMKVDEEALRQADSIRLKLVQ